MFFFGQILFSIMTDIPQLRSVLLQAQILLSIAIFFDCTQGWLLGIIRGLGGFKKAVNGQLLSFYLLSIPIQVFLLFWLDFGIIAIWIGMLVALIVLVLYYLHIIFVQIDVHQVIADAQKRSITDLKQMDHALPIDKEKGSLVAAHSDK